MIVADEKYQEKLCSKVSKHSASSISEAMLSLQCITPNVTKSPDPTYPLVIDCQIIVHQHLYSSALPNLFVYS